MFKIVDLKWSVIPVLTACAVLFAAPAEAQKKYDLGASDTEIKIGNIMPYSGPISSYSTIGKTEAAYFDKINAEGGMNGRKIKFISYDDSSNPAKTVEQARKLVEGDEVLLILQSLGGSMNIAIEKYLNDRKVPQLFVAAPNKRFGDTKTFPGQWGGNRLRRTRDASSRSSYLRTIRTPRLASSI